MPSTTSVAWSSTTGLANFSAVPQTILSGDPQPIVSAINVDGDTSAAWDPLIDIRSARGGYRRSVHCDDRPFRVLTGCGRCRIRRRLAVVGDALDQVRAD